MALASFPPSLPQVAPSGDSRQSETLSDSFGPEWAHSLPSRDQHRVLPHLWGLLLWLRACGGRCTDTWDLCSRAQLPPSSPQSRRSTLHLHQWLERTAGHLGEGEGHEPGAEGGQEEEAVGVVCQLPSADEGEVHWGHRGNFLQKRLTMVLNEQTFKRWIGADVPYWFNLFCGEMWNTTGVVILIMFSVIFLCRLL